jgi:hypothetical protein
MKHIFFVHSHITFQIAISIVQKECFRQNDCIFIGGRGFDPKNSRYPVTPFLFADDCFYIYKNFFKGWSFIKKFDAFIEHLCGGEFIFYCPHTYFAFSPLINTHHLNKGYCLLEEGLTSYTSIKDMNQIAPEVRLNEKQKLLSKLIYRNRYSSRVFFRSDCLMAYCTNPEAFPDQPRKEVVSIELGLDIQYEALAKEIDTLLILDSSVETKTVSADNFIIGFHHMITHFSSEKFAGREIHLKLHPYQYVDRWFADRFINYLRDKLPHSNIVELPSEVSIEYIAIAGHADIYLGISSLAIYASRQGLRVHSFAKYIGECEASYCRKLKQQPQIFYDSVVFL